VTVPLYNLTDVWNSAGTVFTAIGMNVTNTASAAGSLLMDLQIGGTSVFNINKNNTVTIGNTATIDYGVTAVGQAAFAGTGAWQFPGAGFIFNSSYGGFFGYSGGQIGFVNGAISSGTPDTVLFRDAAGILAQRNSTSAQTFRVYNTYSDASNYERAIIDWTTTANVLTIGAEALGSGTARGVQIKAAGGTRLDFFVTDGSLVTAKNTWDFADLGFRLNAGSGQVKIQNSVSIAFCSGAPSTSGDTGVSRSAAGIIAFGNGTQGDASATILAKTKAGAPTTSDVPAGTWALIRDTSGATTKLYYNNAGTLQTVALV